MKNKILIIVLISIVAICCKEDILIEPVEKEAEAGEKAGARSRSSGRVKAVTSPFITCANAIPIGGGTGYRGIITAGDFQIQNTAGLKTNAQLVLELETAIHDAPPNTVIYIYDCTIDISTTITLNKPITIAGNRGHNGSEGAIIRSGFPYDANANIIFNVTSSGVRITGLQFVGQAPESFTEKAIDLSSNITSFEADNCEFYYWSTGIAVTNPSFSGDSLNIRIHHNDIHDNKYPGTGYGIVVGNSYLKIYANIFQDNRHDIAGEGQPLSGYEVYCNTFLEDTTGGQQVANIDMHGGNGSYEDYAGGFMKIHHNDFQDLNWQANIFAVGRPETICIIANNKFKTGNVYGVDSNELNTGYFAIQQRIYSSDDHPKENTPNAYGNVIAVNNTYNNSYLGWYVRETWNRTKTDNMIRIPSTNDLLHSNLNASLSGGWINPEEQTLDYQFGDFNGDGDTDIFKSDGTQWYYLPLNTGYATAWTPLSTSGYSLGTITRVGTSDVYKLTPGLMLSDFNTDNVTDVMSHDAGVLQVSYGAMTAWSPYLTTNLGINQLLFGRFDTGANQYVTDVFKTENGIWSIAYNGSGWNNVNQTAAPFSHLKTGDFNGDGLTDIFYTEFQQGQVCGTHTGVWKYSRHAIYTWTLLNNSSPICSDMFVTGDFNDDNISDIIGLDNVTWSISRGGLYSWQPLTTTNFPLSSFNYGCLK